MEKIVVKKNRFQYSVSDEEVKHIHNALLILETNPERKFLTLMEDGNIMKIINLTEISHII